MKNLQSKMAILLLCLSLFIPTLASAHEVDTNGAAPDLRAALGQLLGEHALLAVVAMQKGYDGAADFPDAAAALGKNTDDLSAAFASVYGKAAGEAFKPIWTSHIGYFVDYVKATAAKDEAGRQQAIAELEDYRMKQAEFFHMANPQYFETAAIADGLKMHINHLLEAFDSYVSKDYANAYVYERTAYAHMFATASELTGGIVAQFPDTFHGKAVKPAVDSIGLKVGSTALTINGKTNQMDVAPLNKNGSIFIPLRYLGEAIGAGVTWDQANQTVWVKTGGNTAAFWVGQSYMELNGQRKEIGSPVFLKNDRVQVPLRFIAELLGWDVQWTPANGAISLTRAAVTEMKMEMEHAH